MSKISMRLFPFLLGALWISLSVARDSAIEPLDSFPRGQLKIATSDARMHPFKIWIAANERRREQGLMFIKSLDEDTGMLFVYPAPQPIAMWMKNTYISLDMVFIKPNGQVARVAANAKPHSLKVIESGESVLGVLELKGGTAQKLGIRPGAIVMHQLFGTDKS